MRRYIILESIGMIIPECLSIINTRLFGEDIDWKQYLINNNLNNFKHALILNCGNGWVERELYDAGIILKATAVEYNKRFSQRSVIL